MIRIGRTFALAALGLALVGGGARAAEQALESDKEFYESLKSGLESGFVSGPEQLDYQYYKLMAAANAAGNPDDVLPKLAISITGPRIGGLREVEYAAVLPDSGQFTRGIVTTGDYKSDSDVWRPTPPERYEDDRKTVVTIRSMQASTCAKWSSRRIEAPFLDPRRCEERVPLVIWLRFGDATDLYFFSQDVMNACDAPEQDLPLDVRAYNIRGERAGAGIVAKAVVRCAKSKKEAAVRLETLAGWGR